jgi:predicted amidohydrolase YtcJ
MPSRATSVMRFLSVAVLGLLIAACDSSLEESEPAETIFYGGDILTMVGEAPEYAESLAVGDGKILALGARQDMQKYQSSTTRLVDLQGKTMLPGFFDAHSHFYQTAVKLSTVNLDPPPAGKTTSIDDILAVLEAELELHPRTENQWLFGWGYDNGMLNENRHPTKEDLDKVSLDIPIAIYHFSGHMLVLNSRGLEEMGFTANSVAPQGGVIRRLPDSREPNGIIEEQATMPVLQLLLASVGGERLFELLDESQLQYKRQGFTTMLEMAALPPLLDAFKAYAAAGKLDIDLASAVMAISQPAKETAQLVSRHYQQGFRVAGAKVNLDGGSPGRTAYLREPYFTQDVGVPADYRGYSSITQQQDLDDLVANYYKLETPIFIHALGDAAIDQAIHAVSAAQKNFPREDIRQQLIHLQVFQPDQMQALKKLDVSLTFQGTHNYYFADFHAANTLGPERTETLCPAGSAWREGFNVTLHHDSPVHPVNQLDLIWIASNRTSRSGKLYGPHERLSVYQALQASTINAAWQFSEEDSKGSLEVGKLADLVILDKNPLKMDKRDIRNIEVIETIKEGRTVWPVSL